MLELPKEFIASLDHILPQEEQDDFLAAISSTASPTSIRFNRKKAVVNTMPDSIQSVDWAKQNAFYLQQRPQFTADPRLHTGAYYVQEAGSMFIQHILTQIELPQQPVVLDLCAAPGGKTTLLLDHLPDDSLLVSNEIVPKRAVILSENVQKWGSPNSLVSNNTPKDFGRLGEVFDLMVVDAPCSGEGMFRKAPHSIQEWSLQNVQICANRQKDILSEAWKSLKVGGYLIYSTCTYNQAENEAILAWLCEIFDAKNHAIDCTNFANIQARQHKNIDCYRFFPHHTQAEGFSVGIIQKLGIPQPIKKQKKRKSKSSSSSDWSLIPNKQRKDLDHYILQPDKYKAYTQQKSQVQVMVPQQHEQTWFKLNQHLKIVYLGLEVAKTGAKGKIIPQNSLAFSIALSRQNIQQYTINELEEAWAWLKGETLQLPSSLKDGWTLITYKGFSLGWAKKIKQRSNNYYPKNWRILMTLVRLKQIDANNREIARLESLF